MRAEFGPKRAEVVGRWRRLHNKEHHHLYASQNIMVIKPRRMRWARHVARMREMRNVYNILVGRPEGNRPLRRAGHRWKDNIRR
jgi:hypothetical protein